MSKKILRCADFPAGDCCASCHVDWEEGYDQPLEVELKDGNEAEVCCRVAIYLNKKGLEA